MTPHAANGGQASSGLTGTSSSSGRSSEGARLGAELIHSSVRIQR